MVVAGKVARGPGPTVADVPEQVGARRPVFPRRFARAGFDSARVQSAADLEGLPFFDKAAIRAAGDDLRSVRAGKLVRYNTGGSSGEPLVFYMGMGRVSHDVAAKWRATRWWGVDIGDTEIVLWGSPVEISKQDRIKACAGPAVPQSPAAGVPDVRCRRWIATSTKSARRRPRMLFGYASALALLARHAERSGVRHGRTAVCKVAFATGETLYPAQREVIERVFGAPVANGYGSRDAGFIAHQCPAGCPAPVGRAHRCRTGGRAGRPVAPGERGEIVTTHLATGDFPFIRYRTGDMAALATEPCACGRGLPALQQVFGRSTDFVRTRAATRCTRWR